MWSHCIGPAHGVNVIVTMYRAASIITMHRATVILPTCLASFIATTWNSSLFQCGQSLKLLQLMKPFLITAPHNSVVVPTWNFSLFNVWKRHCGAPIIVTTYETRRYFSLFNVWNPLSLLQSVEPMVTVPYVCCSNIISGILSGSVFDTEWNIELILRIRF